jgi:hypothetical protein
MTPAFGHKLRSIATVGLCLFGVLGTAGCSPLVTLAGAALGGLGNGSSGGAAPASSGIQGLGAPSLAQNARTTSPVQNQKPTEQAIHDVLNHADNQTVRESCLESLPPEAKLPVAECTTRLSCIPGVSRPLMMRNCPADTAIEEAAGRSTAQNRSAYAGPVWRWGG